MKNKKKIKKLKNKCSRLKIENLSLKKDIDTLVNKEGSNESELIKIQYKFLADVSSENWKVAFMGDGLFNQLKTI